MNKLSTGYTWRNALLPFFSIIVLIMLYYVASADSYSKKQISVTVATDKSEVFVSVKAAKPCELKFFMFNMEGSLVKQLELKENSMSKIISLSKGTYTYDVFNLDARLKSGKIELK